MKVEIILAIVWMTLCVCERQQRSTVLTDESKRVLEQFDFSNFDKQEALNYIDRQRYENQIRGKRSHSKLKRNHDGKNEKILDTDAKINEPPSDNEQDREVKSHLNSEKNENCSRDTTSNLRTSESTVGRNALRAAATNATEAGSKIRRDEFCSKKTERKKAKFIAKCRKCDKSAKKAEAAKKVKEAKMAAKKGRKKKKHRKKKKRHYWGHWSEWSPCSVTCGRGRKIRSRKCVARKCITGELEMGEKACQLPACNLLTKLLGL